MTASTEAVVSGHERGYFQGNIGICENRIVFASACEAERDAFMARCGTELVLVDGSNKAALPGLINTHNHVSMTFMRGYADDMPLMPWLTEKIWPFEAKMTPEDIYHGAKLGIAEMLAGGTTTFLDMYWCPDRVAQAAQEMGMRAVICPTFVDGGLEQFEQEVEQLVALYGSDATETGSLIQLIPAPHAPYTCSPENLRAAVALCKKHRLGVHIHLCETLDEIETIRTRYGKTPVEHLRDLGMFALPTLAAHAVHLTEGDREILRSEGVSIAHNPQSNMKLASGISPVADLLARGVNVALGTDGPSSNNDLDMWEEMRTASLLQKVGTGDPCALPAYQTLQMATTFGARALGRAGELGVLAPGALADVILIDLDKPHLTPCHNLISNLVYCGKAADVVTVIVDGKVLI